MKYAWIKKHKRQFPTAVMCRLLGISTSGYYDSLQHQPSNQQVKRRAIAQVVAVSYFESRTGQCQPSGL